MNTDASTPSAVSDLFAASHKLSTPAPNQARDNSSTAIMTISGQIVDDDNLADLDTERLSLWSVHDVCKWLTTSGLSTLCGNFEVLFVRTQIAKVFDMVIILTDNFEKNDVDGALLVSMDETFIRDSLGVLNALLRKKLLRQVQLLKERRDANAKVLSLVVFVRCASYR